MIYAPLPQSVGYKSGHKIQQRVYWTKLQDVNNLTQHLIDVSAGVERSVVDTIDQRRRRRRDCIQATGGNVEYSL